MICQTLTSIQILSLTLSLPHCIITLNSVDVKEGMFLCVTVISLLFCIIKHLAQDDELAVMFGTEEVLYLFIYLFNQKEEMGSWHEKK